MGANSAAPKPSPEIVFKARNAATASLLPPPNPAPIGTRFSNENFAPPPHPVVAANTRAAFKIKFDSSTGTAGSSHRNENSAARSARKVSPQVSVVATDTKS